MRNYMKTLMAAGFSAIIGLGAVVPAEAMPVRVTPAAPQADNGVVNVQYWRDRGYYDRYEDRGGWYRGHRGYRDYRPGYRRHDNGYWFPLAAFATGAIVGGALAQPREVYRPRPVYREYRPVVRGGLNQSHVNWCYGRYRSYDAYSNTFQPYNGPRRICYSPYG